jgi:hypothetical protein
LERLKNKEMINDILNGDSAGEIRTKLNELIKIVNDYSSSQYYDMGPGPGDAGGGDTGMDYEIYIYDNDDMMLMGTADPASACSAYSMGFSHQAFISKEPMNMGGTQVPEVGDQLYSDYPYMTTAPSGYYAWEDSAMMVTNSIQVDAGGYIVSITQCA